jgi:hypothetical protein
MSNQVSLHGAGVRIRSSAGEVPRDSLLLHGAQPSGHCQRVLYTIESFESFESLDYRVT